MSNQINNSFSKCTQKATYSRFLLAVCSIITFLVTLFGQPYSNVCAASETLLSVNQGFASGAVAIAAKSGEATLSDMSLVDSLSINIGNSEHHWYCGECGIFRSYSKTIVNVYGYKKGTNEEVLIKTYSATGTNDIKPKTLSDAMLITDYMRDNYECLKITASLSSCAASSCGHSGGYYSEGKGYATIAAVGFAKPVIKVGGDLSDKTFIEDCADYIGAVSAYFPGDKEKYQWQYQEDGTWVDVTDNAGTYATKSHGILSLSDKNGKTVFSESNMLMLNNPEVKMSGLKFRVILIGELEEDNTASSESVITVKAKDVTEFYSARFAGRYGQVGELLPIEDIIAYVKFNNKNVVELNETTLKDSRIKYYGFVSVADAANSGDSDSGLSSDNTNSSATSAGGLSAEKDTKEIVRGLNNGTITAKPLSANSPLLKIKQGSNTQYIKLTYSGSTEKSVFEAVTFNGVDEVPPQFDENVELYEADGVTLYTAGNFKISDADTDRKLRIKGFVTDTVNEPEDVSWAYTLTGTKEAKNEITIPVYRSGNAIDIKVEYNGIYTLYASDKAGNTVQKSITVKAFDENNPELKVTVKGNSSAAGTVFSSYKIDAKGSDKEGLPAKAYLYKYFDDEKEAEAFAEKITDLIEDDFTSDSSKTVSAPGYYVVAVRDNVWKIASETVKLPRNGETLDSTRPDIIITPTPVKNLSGELSEYEIVIMDNHELDYFCIKDSLGEETEKITHNHNTECTGAVCTASYHFLPKAEGSYTITAYDEAGNTATTTVSVTERLVNGFEVVGLSQSMSADSVISIKTLTAENRILLKMTDGTGEIYNGQPGIKFEIENQSDDGEFRIVNGENAVKFVMTVNAGSDKEKQYEYLITITGEDNVAPIPGRIETEYSEGFAGELTNDPQKKITLKAADYEDDCTEKDSLVITWYLNGTEIAKAKVSDGGSSFGPFSGEEYNGTFSYCVTDESGNTAYSQSEKIIDCWDMTPPTATVRLLPEGVTADSKARYKQLQIVDAADNKALNAKPYSFFGDSEDHYGIIGSVVAGENASYEICVRDAAGNVAVLGTYSLTGIDSVPPVIEKYDIEKTDDGKTILHITATDTDSTGEDKSSGLTYSIDGENYKESPDFPIEESGEYTIYVKDDTGNITKTGTDYTDTDAPVITAAQGNDKAGYLDITVSDNAGLSRVTMEGPEGLREILQVYDGALEDSLRKEIGRTGKYTVTVMDMAGNTASSEVTVSEIAPIGQASVLSGLRNANSDWTNSDVTIIAELTDTNGLSAAPFKWNGSIPTAHPYIVMSENGSASVDIVDRYGNVIAGESLEITNIDKVAPVITELKQSDDKNSLILKASDSTSGIRAVTISGGPYTVETCAVILDNLKDTGEVSISLPENGSYTVRAYDAAGNCAQKKITAEGVTTGSETVITKEVIKEVTKEVEVPIETVVTQDKIVTQTVEVPKVITVPIPTIEKVTEYKYIRESGQDTSKIIREEIDRDKDGDESDKERESDSSKEKEISGRTETEKHTNETAGQANSVEGTEGYLTADGTYIAPDGYEYFSRVDNNLKDQHPFKYFFKKNAEKIAAIACILCILLLILCLIMGYFLLRDYISQEDNRRAIKRAGRKE